MSGEVRREASVPALHRAAAELFVSAAEAAVRDRGAFSVALAGGNTPRGLYALLAGDASLRARVPWERVRIFFGDERHVPPDHPDSNFRMAQETLLAQVPIAADHVWRMKAEYEDAERTAAEYERDIRAAFALPPGARPKFDLVLLGLGPDGHTASLFPGTAALHERSRLVVANRVEKLDTDRVTLTAPVLNDAREVLFLVAGADKAPALKAVLEGPDEPERFPAQLIRPADGVLRWLVDPAAAAALTVTGSAP